MATPAPNRDADPAQGGWFTTTRWSIVLAAGDANSPQSYEALEALCRTYWYPLYAFVRRRGHDSHEAQDLTQEFFSRLLEKHWLSQVEREKGQFRCFLLAALKHFLANEWRNAQRQKRGGQELIFSLDAERAEGRYAEEPPDCASPDKLFDRRWALILIDRTMKLLETECAATGKSAAFDALKGFVSGDPEEASYVEVGQTLGMSEASVKQTVHRLRQRFRKLFRHEIAQTTCAAAEVDDELRHLYAVLRE